MDLTRPKKLKKKESEERILIQNFNNFDSNSKVNILTSEVYICHEPNKNNQN
jgi:hypothetical protein